MSEAPTATSQYASVGQSLRQIARTLGTDSAHLEAQLLLSEVLGRPRSWLFAYPEAPLGARDAESLSRLTARRANGEPMAYILGTRDFWDMTLKVSPQVLIPRPETEHLVEATLELIAKKRAPRVLDLGTGSGAIAIAIARARADAEVHASDDNSAALDVARENVSKLAPGRVALHRGRWFEAIPQMRFDAVVSNPPYVADHDPHLQHGDVAFEPRTALAAGDEGLDDLSIITAGVRDRLEAGATVLLEHGCQQGPAVRALLSKAGLEAIHTRRDLAGHERLSVARRAVELVS